MGKSGRHLLLLFRQKKWPNHGLSTLLWFLVIRGYAIRFLGFVLSFIRWRPMVVFVINFNDFLITLLDRFLIPVSWFFDRFGFRVSILRFYLFYKTVFLGFVIYWRFLNPNFSLLSNRSCVLEDSIYDLGFRSLYLYVISKPPLGFLCRSFNGDYMSVLIVSKDRLLAYIILTVLIAYFLRNVLLEWPYNDYKTFWFLHSMVYGAYCLFVMLNLVAELIVNLCKGLFDARWLCS